MKRLPRLDLNPSSADRWTTCTASPQFILDNWDKVPQSTDTVYNMAGTTAHAVAANFLGAPMGDTPVPIDEEMLMHGWNYHEYVLNLREPGSRMLVEQKLPLWYMPARNCIVDAAVINPKSLHIVDYKYGEGVVVHPERSLQATIYAQTIGSGMLPFPPDDFPVFVHIYQPRGRAGETGPGHVWETTWGEIANISHEISCNANLIQGKFEGMPLNERYTRFAPSDKACQWCPAKGFCTARQASLAEGFEVIESQSTPPAPAVLSLEQRARIQHHAATMKEWLDDVTAYNLERMRGGEKLPGFKLVLSRGGNRKWSDEKKAAELLVRDTVLKRSEVIEETTIGPAAVEKLIGKNKLSADLTALITKPPGSPVIAPDGDKREAIMGAEDVFEVISEGITTKGGLLYQHGAMIPLPEADSVAIAAGFNCAEEYVRHLEKSQIKKHKNTKTENT